MCACACVWEGELGNNNGYIMKCIGAGNYLRKHMKDNWASKYLGSQGGLQFIAYIWENQIIYMHDHCKF